VGLQAGTKEEKTKINIMNKTIKLTSEIRDTNNKLGESNNYQLENRIEQSLPSYEENCRIM